MTIKKLQDFKLNNKEVYYYTLEILLNEKPNIDLLNKVINTHIPSYSKKMNECIKLMLNSKMLSIIENDFTYKKRCQKTSILKQVTEKRQYYLVDTQNKEDSQ